MKEVVTCILNILVTCLVSLLLNLHFVEKRRYRELKKLNVQMDILLKAFELEHKGVPIPDHIQLYIKELYETAEEEKQ